LTAIKEEHRILGQILHEFPVDLIIADNRYGFHHHSVYSVIISHQLSIKTGLGQIADRFISKTLAGYMDRFDETWIPDNDTDPHFAGMLSKPFVRTSKQVYIGPLSRFDYCPEFNQKHILIVLSGPEPQRSILEKIILHTCDSIEAPIVLVRGSDTPITQHNRTAFVVHDFADTTLLNQLMCDASIIVSRSGYTSLMDILKLKKRWIAIATPGQAEQEYLADYLHENRWAMSVHQSEFNLATALNQAARFEFEHPSINTEKYKETITGILSL